MNSDEIELALAKLNRAVSAKRSRKYCLRLWSEFVRSRDDFRCVVCGHGDELSAHHVFRKTLLKELEFQSGNGITLCRECHSQPHEVFNGKPDLGLPMDAQSGENIDLAMDFLHRLINDGRIRGILNDNFYHLSDAALRVFKRAQSIDENLVFPGLRIEQAYLIWRQTPRRTMQALLGAHGIQLPSNFIQGSPGITFFFDSETGE